MPPIPLRADLVGADHIFVQRILSTTPHRAVASARPHTAAARSGLERRTVSSRGLPTPAGVSAGVDCSEAAAVSALTAPVGMSRNNGDVSFPWPLAVVETFAAFLHLMKPASPPLSEAVSLSGSQTARAAACSTIQGIVADDGQPSLIVPIPPQPQLPSPADSAFRSMSSLPSGPTPPPYVETPALQAAFSAGAFTSAQHLVAHVRLLLQWTVVAARRRRRVVVSGDDLAGEVALTSLSSSPLPIASASERASNTNTSSLSYPPHHGAPSTGSAATTRSSHFVDGDVALVSDRVDAVLPTWAYLSSHIADATPPALLMPTPTGALARGEPLTAASAGGSLHRGSHSRNSSMASSIVGGVPDPLLLMSAAPAIVDERVDRGSCLYPYGLAEACALAQRQKLASKTAAGAASALSSLHLLRLELQVDVERVSPAVRNVAPVERQRMLDQALAEFSLTGVLPATVLRGVLNDAALRLLGGVDNEVLRRVAGEVDLATPADVEPHNGVAPSGSTVPAVATHSRRRRVMPLSLHVHAHQGMPNVAAATTADRPLPSTSVRSATVSTNAGKADSPLRMPTGATTTPTRLILTMLVHVEQTSATFTAPEAQEVSATHEGQRSQVNGEEGEGAAVTVEAVAPFSSAAGATARMDDTAAASLASAVVPYLFPLTFGLSSFTTKVSLSTAVDYDALRTEAVVLNAEGLSSSTVEAVKEEVAASSAGIADMQAAEFGEDAAVQPLTWQDISVSTVRALCGVPELQPPPTPAPTMPFSSPSTLSHAACSMTAGTGRTASATTSLNQQPILKRRRSSKSLTSESAATIATVAQSGAVTAAAAAVHASEAVSDTAADQGVGLGRSAKSRLAEKNEEKAEIDPCSAVAESVRRWDVDKEMEALTSAVEAVQCCVRAIGGRARLLWALAETGECETEADEADGGGNGAVSYRSAGSGEQPQQVAREGRRSTVVLAATSGSSATGTAHRRRCAGHHAGLQGVMETAQQVLACGLTLLIATGLSVSEPLESSEEFFMAERATAGDAEKQRADSRAVFVSILASPDDSEDSAVAHECGIAQELRRWFSGYDRYLSAYLYAPLRQLQALMEATIGRAATTPRAATAASVMQTDNGSRDRVPNTTRRAVPGSQTIVKETRRHRRHATRVKASQGDAKSDGAGVVEEADRRSVDPLVLPALSIARATVQLCRTMARKSAPLHDAVAVASCKELSSRQHTPTTAAGGCAHPLRERVASLVDTITGVLRLLEAEERRWAALQEPVAVLKGRWCDMWAIINEEHAQRGAKAQSLLVNLERQMRSKLVMEEALGFSSTEAERITNAAAVRAAANSGPVAAALAADSGSASAETLELDERSAPASESDARDERHVAQQPTRAPVATLSSMPDLREDGLSRAPSLELPQPAVSIAKESAEGRATAGANGCLEVEVEKALLSPSPPRRSRASRDEQEEAEAEQESVSQDAFVEKVAMVEDSEAGESGGDGGIEAAVEKLPDESVTFVEAATPFPPALPPTAASSRPTTAPTQEPMLHRHQPNQNGPAKRSRRAQATRAQPQAQPRSRATVSRALTSQNGAAPSTSLPNVRALTAASSSSARPSQQWSAAANTDAGAGAAASVKGGLALALRMLQPLSTLAPLYVDEAVLRQATPFVTIGAVLFLLLILL
ncbi:hypothetical protein CUR178_06591 [Leishmania enriettii]|uniref:Cysteine peptidase B (CPB) n=1 Tax=Leishmania enriettii TaxID=5663 RepID=A0A836HVW5_LEIEN|nr:hypothetical protein CUR178_06591 [Leishmania enriettii]